MKKSSILLVMSILIVLLIGCGKDNPKASDKAISCADRAISVCSDYLSGETDADNVLDTLDEIDMSYIDNMDKEDEFYFQDYRISTYIFSLKISVMADDSQESSDSYSNLKEKVQELKEYKESCE